VGVCGCVWRVGMGEDMGVDVGVGVIVGGCGCGCGCGCECVCVCACVRERESVCMRILCVRVHWLCEIPEGGKKKLLPVFVLR